MQCQMSEAVRARHQFFCFSVTCVAAGYYAHAVQGALDAAVNADAWPPLPATTASLAGQLEYLAPASSADTLAAAGAPDGESSTGRGSAETLQLQVLPLHLRSVFHMTSATCLAPPRQRCNSSASCGLCQDVSTFAP